MGQMGARLGLCAAGGALGLGLAAPVAWGQEPGVLVREDCVREDISIAGEPAGLVGAEDLAFDPRTGVLFISAFDRYAVAEALEKDTPPPDGILILAQRAEAGWEAQSVAVGLPAGDWSDQFRPHGIALSPEGDRLAVINRRYEGKRRNVSIEVFAIDEAAITHQATLTDRAFCRANDLTFAGEDQLLVSFDHAGCADWAALTEDIFSLRRSGVLVVPLTLAETDEPARLARLGRGFSFANGVTWSEADDGAWLAATREKRVYFLPSERLFDEDAGEDAREIGFVELSGHPDNVTQTPDGALLVAQHPRLIQLAWHRSDPDNSAGSLVARVDQEGEAVVFQDKTGRSLAAATVAVEADGQMVLGSATDAGLLVCESVTP